MRWNKDLGDKGEAMAARYLRRQGCRILERSYRCRWGEVDIIAQKGKTLLFVEVKTRSQSRFGAGREAVTAQKQVHMMRTALAYLADKKLGDVPIRFDVIEIDSSCEPPTLNHIPNAVESRDNTLFW